MLKEIRRSRRDAAGTQPVLYDNELLRDMRKAGWPVTGIISVNGVTEGRLEMTFDRSTREHVYRYYTPAECGVVDEDPL